MQQFFAYAVVITFLIGFIPYIADVIKGRTKPERAGWFIWLVLGTIAFISQIPLGGRWSLVLPAVDVLAVGTIFVLSLWHGVGGFARRDILSLIVAGIGLILWYFTSQPVLALIISLAVDSAGSYLIVMKAYELPETEMVFAWVMGTISGICALLVVGSWSWQLFIYPLYLIVVNSFVIGAVYIGRARDRRLGLTKT